LSELATAPRFSAAKWLLLAGSLSWGCGEILGLEEPHPRPVKQTGGASGQATGGISGTEAGEGGIAGIDQGGMAGAEGGTGGSGTSGTGDQGGTAGDPGGAGTGGSSDGCTVNETRCGGETSKTPEVCDDERNWVVNVAENGGVDCTVYCEGGACTECENDKPPACHGKVPQLCVDGAWRPGTACVHYCRNGVCENPPSCAGSIGACGSEGATCCSALEVPGGSFFRDYDDADFTNMNYPATLSSFLLDEFEVTVGRFRNFVNAYGAVQRSPGDGKAEHIKCDTGWRTNYRLPEGVEELRAQLACTGSTWTDVRASNDQRPVNCVDFFVAYAFCIWDGGRLPT
jgi:formylglycine-generating enzyme